MGVNRAGKSTKQKRWFVQFRSQLATTHMNRADNMCKRLTGSLPAVLCDVHAKQWWQMLRFMMQSGFVHYICAIFASGCSDRCVLVCSRARRLIQCRRMGAGKCTAKHDRAAGAMHISRSRTRKQNISKNTQQPKMYRASVLNRWK